MNLLILFHVQVLKTRFKVSGQDIQKLFIMRYGTRSSEENYLAVSGSSKFADIRLEDWTTQPSPSRSLYFGENGIKMEVDPERSETWRNAAAQPGFSKELDDLKRSWDGNGEAHEESDWWDTWKAVVALITGFGVATATVCLSVKGAITGAFVALKTPAFSLTAGYASAAVKAAFTAAGPAVLLGVLTAAVIYFVPWRKLCRWISEKARKIVDNGLWAWFAGWLDSFKSLLDRFLERMPGFAPRPAEFAY